MKCFSNGFLTRILSLLLVCSMLSVSFGSAANARFIQPDTMDPTVQGVGTNRYAYAGNDPVNNSDPNGHIWGLVAAGIGALAGWLGGSKPANAPADSSQAQHMSDAQSLGNSAAAVVGVTGAGGWLGRAASWFSKEKEPGKELVGAEERARNLDDVSPESTSNPASALQGQNLKEYYRQAEKYGAAGVKELENGKFRFYGDTKAANTPGQMAGSRFVREWDPATGNTRNWYETLDHSGQVRSVAPKPVTGPMNHRIFDAWGNYIGRR